MRLEILRQLLPGFLVAILSLTASPAMADFEIGRIEATGKTRDDLMVKAYSAAVTQGMVRYYGFQSDNPLIKRILGRGSDRIKQLIAGVPTGPVGQRGAEFAGSLVFRGNETAFDEEIKSAVEQFLRASGAKHVLTAFVVTSSKQVILEAESEWLRGRNSYTADAAVRRATDRLSKAGLDVDRLVQATMARYGIPFRDSPPEFDQALITAHSDVANRSSGSEFAAIEKTLRDNRGDFDRAAVSIIDIDSVLLKDNVYFVNATISGRLYDHSGAEQTGGTRFTPLHMIARGFGGDLDAALHSVLQSAAREVIVSRLLASMLNTSAEQASYTVKLCGFDKLADVREIKEILSDMGRVVAADNGVYSVINPRLKEFDEFAFELDDKLRSRKYIVKQNINNKLISIGKCT